ncbi:aminoglycoside phosphotransferase family protein [Hallella sp.]|uniref:phosphotransferase enzyme family protein n=1 Tax=Hallella TaxID=52228 RepID=UPI00285024ED|nr:aminoglycoside phosphotransferase family protein [Hallella sp.]MCI7434442.1 aminoglycoside phosphotransferase family protein [Prevotella sp.]MDR3844153.1 aminoglycoside phosphotransferase family protein [Hallella sp.]MDY5925344.1 aminoglycoside phosphotransferase family protein [Hallella sp.]MED9946170.1 aminoglycoside phosphotransferase family protein [Hallella sp.]
MSTFNLDNILSQFLIEGKVESVKPLGNGLINDTFRVVTEGDAPDYVLQRINNNIFTDVDLLQHNIEAVTGHIRRKLEAAGADDIDRKVLRFVPTQQGKTYYLDNEGRYWRVSVFIPDAVTYEQVDPTSSRNAGKAFGEFESMLVDLPEQLGETIPDFHNMELRARQLQEAIEQDKAGRVAGVADIIADLQKDMHEMCKAERLFREGKLPKRICHCDTKVNNMMYDKQGNVLCVIDLDTVMPSFVFSDYGDFLRTGANFVAEDDPKIENVGFNQDIFRAFTEGYIESARSFLTPVEVENLPYAVALFPFMQCVRFFADYLNGDTYYKIAYPEHNLVRTRNQQALYHRVTDNYDMMDNFIRTLI